MSERGVRQMRNVDIPQHICYHLLQLTDFLFCLVWICKAELTWHIWNGKGVGRRRLNWPFFLITSPAGWRLPELDHLLFFLMGRSGNFRQRAAIKILFNQLIANNHQKISTLSQRRKFSSASFIVRPFLKVLCRFFSKDFFKWNDSKNSCRS